MITDRLLPDLAAVAANLPDALVARQRIGGRVTVLLDPGVLARRNDRIDPLVGLKIKKAKPAPQPCFTRAEVDKLLADTKPPYSYVLHFLADTGGRVGEAKFLTWEDVDLERGWVRIRPKDDWKPKSGDQRAVPLSPALRRMLTDMPRKGRWVFTAPITERNSQEGRQIDDRRLLDYFKRIVKRHKLKGHLHTFRHAFISYALTVRKVAEHVVRQWVGHVDSEIIRMYTHVADDISQDAMKSMFD